MDAAAIAPDRYYSNGAYGRTWGVRMVVAIDAGAVVHFKGIAGTCRRKAASCTLAEFSAWARYEVALNENSWQRVGNGQ